MKVFKSFLLYAGILLGLCVAVVLCCLVAMLLFKAEIFGYKYVSYKSVEAPENIPANIVSAIEINVSDMEVEIIPTNEDVIKVSYTEAMYGFVKSELSEFKCTTEIDSEKTFAESSTIYKTYVVNFTEPSGWILSNDSKVTVHVPYNKLSVLSVKSQKGNITYNYNQEKNEESFAVDTIYAQSTKGNIQLLNVKANNVYATTTSGALDVDSISSIYITQLQYTTDSGKLTLVKNLTGSLKVLSTSSVTGPYISGKTIMGGLNYNAYRGIIDVEQVGQENKNIYFTVISDYVSVKVKKVYGTITTSPKTDGMIDHSIALTIGDLVVYNPSVDDDSMVHAISIGNGDLQIDNIDYTISVISNSGNVKLNNVKITNGNVNITAGENSSVVVNFDETVTPSQQSKFAVDIKNGNLTATNVKMLTAVNANSERSGTINMVFTDIRADGKNNYKANVINTGSHNVVLKIKNSLSYRMLISQPAGDKTEIAALGTTTDIVEGNNDFVTDIAYKKQLRVNYAESDYINVGNIRIVADGGSVSVAGIA